MIEFYVSADAEKQKLMDMFCVEPVGVSLAYRAKQYHFPLELAEKMYARPRAQWDSELEDLLEAVYARHRSEMQEALSFFQAFWHKNGVKYLPQLEIFFGSKWPTYRVLLAYYLDVISNWKECNIVINYALYQKENVLFHVYSILFEMVLAQVFIKIRELKNRQEMSDNQVWGCSELAACVILNKLYPEFKNATKTGYPQLDEKAPLFFDFIQKHNQIDSFLNEILAADVVKNLGETN